MPGSRTPRKTAPVDMSEEIERIRMLLRRLDEMLQKQGDLSLKDLAQGVRTAGDGGRSIAQLRKLARQIGSGSLDEEAEQLRAQMLDTLDKLGRHRQENAGR